MPRVSTYLNFPRETEAAFDFYRGVFGTEFIAPVRRYGDMAHGPGCKLADGDHELILHIELPILGGHVLMGTDAPPSMGFDCKAGNNVSINLEPDTRAETRRLYAALSEGGTIEMALAEMFWGGYFASFSDRFGTRWMLNCMAGE